MSRSIVFLIWGWFLVTGSCALAHPLVVYTQPAAEITDASGTKVADSGAPFDWTPPADPQAEVVFLVKAAGYKPVRLEYKAGRLQELRRLPEQGVVMLQREWPRPGVLVGIVIAALGLVWRVRGRSRAVAVEADFVRAELLGEGQTSRVYAATSSLAPGEALAVKIFKAAGRDGDADEARLRRSLQLVAGMEHPGLVRVLGSGRTPDDHPYLLSERLDGETLESFLSQHPRPASERVLSICRDLCSVLGYLHGKGVVHRDVKPGNIFLTADGGLKLIDLDISRGRESEDLTRPGVAIGTPFYISPEQARGEVWPASDQYSVGVLLFEMLTGRLPFQGSGPEVIAQHINEPVPPARSLDPTITVLQEAVLYKMLAKDHRRRFADMAECGRAIEQAMGPATDDQTATQI